MLFSILAIVSGANSYRGVKTFIKVHRQKLNKAFKIGWKRPPAHTSIRFILQGLKAEDVEKAFREHAANLNSGETVCNGATPLSGVQTVDGKKRNRHETRTVVVFDAAPAVMGTQWEPCVAAIIQVERIVLTFQPATGLWRRSCENSFYLSNRPAPLEQLISANL